MKKSSLKKYITLLEAAADSATHARDYWMREHERRVEELLEADNEIAKLERRLDDNGGLCTLRAKLIGETCKETNDRLREVNEIKDEELLEAKNYIAELKAAADSAANVRDYWIREHELKDEELLEAKNYIAELERRNK